MNKEREADIAKFWNANSIYQKAKRKGKKFYFLDGPPIENKVQEDKIMASGKANLIC